MRYVRIRNIFKLWYIHLENCTSTITVIRKIRWRLGENAHEIMLTQKKSKLQNYMNAMIKPILKCFYILMGTIQTRNPYNWKYVYGEVSILESSYDAIIVIIKYFLNIHAVGPPGYLSSASIPHFECVFCSELTLPVTGWNPASQENSLAT